MAKATKAKATKATETAPIDALASHAIKWAGKDYSAMDVANMASSVQNTANELEMSKDSFGQIFVAMAATCKFKGKDCSDFLATMGSIEANMSWKSKQNPSGSVDAPKVWTQTKSNIKCANEQFGFVPVKDYKTTADLNKLLNDARKQAKENTTKDETAETVTEAIVKADSIDKSFSNLLVKLTGLYESLDDTGRRGMFNDLAEIYNLNCEEKELLDLLTVNTREEELKEISTQAASH